MITTEIGELLEAPQWINNQWNSRLQMAVVEAICGQCMYRAWLESIGTVHELTNEGLGEDGQPMIERFLLPDVKGRMVTWLEPGGSVIDQTVVAEGVFEPPSQYLSFAGGIPFENLREAEPRALLGIFGDVVDAAARTLDDGFRRRVGQLRQASGELHIGLWDGLKSRQTSDTGSWTITGSVLAAAAVIGVVIEAPAPPSDDLQAEIAEARAFVDERSAAGLSAGASEDAPSEGTPPAPAVDAEVRAEVEERSPAAAHADADEPAGDLVEVADDETRLDRRAAHYDDVPGAEDRPGAIRTR